MANESNEADWKVLRQLHAVDLDRFCDRILKEIDTIRTDMSKTNHQRYLDIWALIRRRDDQVEWAFNDMRRSTMMSRICAIRSLGLFSDEEFSRFSLAARQIVRDILRQE